mmetsp:Transcript_2053/g.3242  ORF Transcript_2053/g.3242 Transcript_2053/m.3242 type:complete len:247 (-) Transcript_2053:31-771(-)
MRECPDSRIACMVRSSKRSSDESINTLSKGVMLVAAVLLVRSSAPRMTAISCSDKVPPNPAVLLCTSTNALSCALRNKAECSEPRMKSSRRPMGHAMGEHRTMSSRTNQAEEAPTFSPYREQIAWGRISPNMRTTDTDSTTAVTGSASLSIKSGRASVDAALHSNSVTSSWWLFLTTGMITSAQRFSSAVPLRLKTSSSTVSKLMRPSVRPLMAPAIMTSPSEMQMYMVSCRFVSSSPSSVTSSPM